MFFRVFLRFSGVFLGMKKDENLVDHEAAIFLEPQDSFSRNSLGTPSEPSLDSNKYLENKCCKYRVLNLFFVIPSHL